MNTKLRVLIVAAGLAALSACSSQPVNKPIEAIDRGSGAEMAELRREVGCTDEEVMVCIEANCKPENYGCAPKRDIRRMFENKNLPL